MSLGSSGSVSSRVASAAVAEGPGRGAARVSSEDACVFDSLSRLQKETKASGQSRYFLYTADDERILTYDPNLPSVFHFALRDFNGKVLRTFDRILPDPSNTLIQYSLAGRDYIHAGDRVVGTADPKQPMTTRMWATLDHLGTPRLWTGVNAEALRKHKYYPYGEEMTPSDQWNVALQFTGHERDANNLGGPADDGDNMHARFGSLVAGRFLSIDSAHIWALQSDEPEARQQLRSMLRHPQSWNRASYALGNPETFVDRDGRSATLAIEFAASLGASASSASTGAATAGAFTAALPLSLAIGSGIVVGAGVNMFPGVSEALTFDPLSDALSSVLFSSQAKAAADFIDLKAASVQRHISKYPIDPNDPDDKGNKSNIYRALRGQLKSAREKLKRLAGRSRKDAEAKLRGAEESLENWWSGGAR